MFTILKRGRELLKLAAILAASFGAAFGDELAREVVVPEIRRYLKKRRKKLVKDNIDHVEFVVVDEGGGEIDETSEAGRDREPSA